jgi:putative adhesin
MSQKPSIICLIAMVALNFGPLAISLAAQSKRGDRAGFKERDEIHQTIQLSSGARVLVESISGPVEIETVDGDTAEVNIIRSSPRREDLNYNKVLIERSPTSLVVRGSNNPENHPSGGAQVHQYVKLKIPRRVELAVSSVSAYVEIGQVEGPVEVNSVSGSLQIGHAVGHLGVSSISGSLSATISRLDKKGVNINSISGAVDLFFKDQPDADLTVTSFSGKVFAELPNVTVQGALERDRFQARIGAGGSPITIGSISGYVRLAPAPR